MKQQQKHEDVMSSLSQLSMCTRTSRAVVNDATVTSDGQEKRKSQSSASPPRVSATGAPDPKVIFLLGSNHVVTLHRGHLCGVGRHAWRRWLKVERVRVVFDRCAGGFILPHLASILGENESAELFLPMPKSRYH